jgi:pimeloyl-ACP methyl ester carboxylesterase
MGETVQYSANGQRFAELRQGANGRLVTEWQLTDTKLFDAVRIAVPPQNAVPIVFVPGIMGSNLCNLKGIPVWLLNGIKNKPLRLAAMWTHKDAGFRQLVLHPAKTKVYDRGHVPEVSLGTGLKRDDFLGRGWGEVSEASYHSFLLWLDQKLNGSRNPAEWDDFTHQSAKEAETPGDKRFSTLPAGLAMRMRGLPESPEVGYRVDPVTSDELLRRAKCVYPVYACGYNWLDTNVMAAQRLKSRIESIIAENDGPHIRCRQVILVTHSMGGLVARACAQLAGMSQKILGIVHGVMPATGAAVAYRRCKVGMQDEDMVAGLVIGSSGKEVSPVFAQSPGALQLLPSEDYGKGWLSIRGVAGAPLMSLPKADPYEEIYLERNKWWGLMREEWLEPDEGEPIEWSVYAKNIKAARAFHRQIAASYHHNTFVFYGATTKQSFQRIFWNVKKGTARPNKSFAENDLTALTHADVTTDGSNHLYVGRDVRVTTVGLGDSSFPLVNDSNVYEINCGKQDSVGDGTVPASSGRTPRNNGGKNVIQQFAIDNIEHEPAYRDSPVAQQVAYYAITKLSALAEL